MGKLFNARVGRRFIIGLLVAGALIASLFAGARLLPSSTALASTLGEAPSPTPAPSATATPTPTASPSAASLAQPRTPITNVVVLLADDLDTATFDQVRRLHTLRARGLSLNTHVVTDSLCCPSRASILRSQYVHNHKVLSNLLASGGGWATFNQNGDEADCLPVWLHQAGVQTAFIGKYLNGYGEDGDPTAIPPGWDRWFVPTTKSGMYRGYGYTVNDNGTLNSYANRPRDFLPNVITTKAVEYLRQAQSPFYLQVNATSPHDPAPVAPKHQTDDRRVRAPKPPSFNSIGENPAAWRAGRKPLTAKKIRHINQYWRQRAQSTESFADTVDAVIAELDRTGRLASTLIVVTSDNGFHAGTRRLPPGKRTPYLEDTIVPTVLIGPGITPAAKSYAPTSMIDLAPTIADLLGVATPDWLDGRSLAPLFAGTTPATWRTGVLTESLGESTFADPDFQAVKPPNFHALRSERWLYVEYVDGTSELFDRASDPYETRNVVASTPPEVVAVLHDQLQALSTCAGETCRTADAVSESPVSPQP